MSLSYRAIDWNRQKRWYDFCAAGILLFGGTVFLAVSGWVSPEITAETAILRVTAFLSLWLLHVILCIGPAARLDNRFLPLLYNRRHLGVTLFALAFVHAALATFQFHAFSNANPILSVFTAYRRDYLAWDSGYSQLGHFPFEPFGAATLAILFLLAATSHDFWLRQLGPSLWKTLHFGVYGAYVCLVAHVAFGVLQAERTPAYPVLLGFGFFTVGALHVAAAVRGGNRARGIAETTEGFVDVGPAAEIEEGRGRVVKVAEISVAVFRHKNRLYTTSNVCRHQGGPLGEGRILDGCITCPWHGWNYRPEDGCSPPPFQERLETFPIRIENGRIHIQPRPHPLGTTSPGAAVESTSEGNQDEFYVGYHDSAPPRLRRRTRVTVVAIAATTALVAAISAGFQTPADIGTFEFGIERSFEGILREKPTPLLQATAVNGMTTNALYLLVGAGKHGPPSIITGHDGQWVRFVGTAIGRRGDRMIEMNQPETFAVVQHSGPAPAVANAVLGVVRFSGELIDTKCYLGVMRPATGKVHRACAVRCLAGGIPPGLLVRDAQGQPTVVVLGGPGGALLKFDPQWGGRVVEATGELSRIGSNWFLATTEFRLAD